MSPASSTTMRQEGGGCNEIATGGSAFSGGVTGCGATSGSVLGGGTASGDVPGGGAASGHLTVGGAASRDVPGGGVVPVVAESTTDVSNRNFFQKRVGRRGVQ
jgi:hypothetical protein